jgi:hypothetical protein
MPCALIINTLADVLAELFFEVVCICYLVQIYKKFLE